MKKLFLFILVVGFLTMFFSSCQENPNQTTKVKSIHMECQDFQYKGHIYIYFEHESTLRGSQIVHAAHCPCFNGEE